jgi:hypothetical protein
MGMVRRVSKALDVMRERGMIESKGTEQRWQWRLTG